MPSGLTPTELSELLGNLATNGALTDSQRQAVLEIQAPLKAGTGHQAKTARRLLREQGPGMLELILKALREANASPEERRGLERTSEMLASYLLSFWLPTAPWRKILMFFFLAIGVVGTFWWSPWFVLLILVASAFSPRVSGEVTNLVSRLNRR